MATMTKPRPRAKTSMPSAAYAEIVAQARKHIMTTKRQVTQIKAETGVNRSTRDQRAVRRKADAFDRLDDILAGRE